MKKIILAIIILILITACSKQQANNIMIKNIRQPVAAGQFYPADKEELKTEINKYLAAVVEIKNRGTVKAIIVPHAGYIYSGQVAGFGYKNLVGSKIKTVVIVSNSHTAYFDGIAIDGSDGWQTPLGTVEIDKELAKKLVAADNIFKFSSSAHSQDHAIEVQLPFLQTVLADGFKIVPILFGNSYDGSYKKLAQALAENLPADDLVVISSDMSHYPNYDEANRIDKLTLDKIKAGSAEELEKYLKQIEGEKIANEQTLLCGIDGVKTVIDLAKQSGWDNIEILKYANSGDTIFGDKSRVVGYGAMIFTKNTTGSTATDLPASDENSLLNDEQKNQLLKIAVETIGSYIRLGKLPKYDIKDDRLNIKQGAFVTLNKNGQLRGCIGQILPGDKALWQVVQDMAVAAATADPRFSPITKEELPNLEYEISVLSVPEKISDWQKIELGKDGVIVQKGQRSGVFLPQVATETGWSREEFLSQLCWQKAGLPPDSYKNDPQVELKVFTAQVFSTTNP